MDNFRVPRRRVNANDECGVVRMRKATLTKATKILAETELTLPDHIDMAVNFALDRVALVERRPPMDVVFTEEAQDEASTAGAGVSGVILR